MKQNLGILPMTRNSMLLFKPSSIGVTIWPTKNLIYTLIMRLEYLNSQSNVNKRHVKWVSFLQQFTFSSKHQSGILNKVIDGLSKRTNFLVEIQAKVAGFEVFKENYQDRDGPRWGLKGALAPPWVQNIFFLVILYFIL